MRFYVPPNLQSDWQYALLSELSTSFTINFNLSNIAKAIVPEIDYREKSGDSIRNTKPTFVDINSNLKIGDYLQDENGVYIVNQLKIEKFPKCFKVYTGVCNFKLNITRFEEAVYDNEGNVITEAGDYPIISDTYCATQSGSLQFKTGTGSVGIIPSDQIIIQIQYNDNTKNAIIGDKFYWFAQKYQIVNIDYSQVNVDDNLGLVVFYGEKLVDNS